MTAGGAVDPEALQAVKSKALALLARREHSVKELAAKVAARVDADEATVRAAVEELAARGLVSDERYAAAYARDAVRLKPRAGRRIVTELVERGVPARTAGRAVEEAFADEGVDDRDLARGLAGAYAVRLGDEPLETRWRRLAGYLQRRGFDNALVYDVCEQTLGEGGPPGP